jgi:hypothetical protein
MRQIVQAFIGTDCKVPKESVLPRPVDREICRLLEERRDFPAIEVIDALKLFAQPELLETNDESVSVEEITGDPATTTVVAPISSEDLG